MSDEPTQPETRGHGRSGETARELIRKAKQARLPA